MLSGDAAAQAIAAARALASKLGQGSGAAAGSEAEEGRKRKSTLWDSTVLVQFSLFFLFSFFVQEPVKRQEAPPQQSGSYGAPPASGPYGGPPPAGQYGGPPSDGRDYAPPHSAYGAPPSHSAYGAPPPSQQQSQYGGPPPGQGAYGAPPGQSAGYPGQQPVDPSSLESFSIEVPQSIVGLVIGKGGDKIKEIQDMSGASVQVCVSVALCCRGVSRVLGVDFDKPVLRGDRILCFVVYDFSPVCLFLFFFARSFSGRERRGVQRQRLPPRTCHRHTAAVSNGKATHSANRP